MLSPYIHAALAHERHQTFLAQAETDRRARQARLYRRQAGTLGARRSPLRRYPAWLRAGRSRLLGRWPRSAVTGRPVVLRDGSTVLIRQVQSADAPVLADGFARLSARSRQLRFLTPRKELAPVTIVTGTRQTKAPGGAYRVSSFDSYSGWAQCRVGAAGLIWSAVSRMKAVVRWARCRIVLRGCDRSPAGGRGGPVAEGVGE
jgi:hypothetical protein